MRIVNKPGFTRWAIVLVSILIGLTLVAIGVLAYEIAKQEQALPFLHPSLDAAMPTATRVHVAPSALAATRMPEPAFTPAETPLNHPPTGISSTDTPLLVSQQIPESPHVHPTYEPTTEPCQSCHPDVHGRAGGE